MSFGVSIILGVRAATIYRHSKIISQRALHADILPNVLGSGLLLSNGVGISGDSWRDWKRDSNLKKIISFHYFFPKTITGS